MFKVECFVDDKHLPKALISLDGLAIDLKVVPVRNAIKANGKLQSTAALSIMAAITNQTKKLPPKSIVTPTMMRGWLEAGGLSPGSCATALVQAIEHKVLRKTKRRAEYEVIGGA